VTSQRQRDSNDRDQFEDVAYDAVAVAREMSRLLESRRWDLRGGPFRGFGSPPGRF